MWNTSQIAAPVSVPVIEPVFDVELGEVVPTVTGHQPGYHVNLPEDLMTPDLEPYRVYPEEPASVLLGVPTAFLRFTDADEAIAALGAFTTV